MENRSVTYVVEGNPVPLKRPRFSGVVYDPQKADKKSFGWQLKSQQGSTAILTGMLHMTVTFFMELPKKKSHREQLLKQGYHCYRPDLSNLIKFVEDVCVDAGIIEDDALIVEISSKKVYSEQSRTEFYFTLVEEL